MVIIDYQKKHHKQIIAKCVKALEQGQTVVYPTDTSYGLGADATNFQAVIKVYRIKARNYQQPVHIIPPSLVYAKRITVWSSLASKLVKNFWPGPLTLVLPIKPEHIFLKQLAAKTGNIGLRMPKNGIALDLAKNLNKPITTTSANPTSQAGGYESYSLSDVLKQFKNRKYRPDIIINAGKLPKRKPSTFVKIEKSQIQILRAGPITLKQIQHAFK